MQAGRLDCRILIEQVSETQDAVNDAVPTWSTFAEVWAERVRGRGTETTKADRETAEREVVFKIRYLSGLDETMRIVFDGATYDIEAIEELGRKEGFEVRAVAQVA